MTQVITTSVKDLVAAANAEVTTLTVEQARTLIDSPDHILVDLRDIRELQRTGKIPGAFSRAGCWSFGLIRPAPITKRFSTKIRPMCSIAPALGVRP